MITSLLVLAFGSTITVDDNGPANFAEIQAAIDNASAGDLILVEPGQYAPFTIDRDLTILGRSGAMISVTPGTCLVLPIANLTLGGLELPRLIVQGVNGQLVIDACSIGGSNENTTFTGGLQLQNTPNATITRCAIDGIQNGGIGLELSNSLAHVADCAIAGGEGHTAFFGSGGSGGAGISVNSSTMFVAGCDVQGGAEGVGFSQDGPSGHGIRAWFSTVVVRGSSFHSIARGDADPVAGQFFGAALFADQGAKIVWSGVTLVGATTPFSSGQITAALVTEPYLVIQGSDLPSQNRRVKLFGPTGQSAFLLASLVPAALALPGFEGALGLAPPFLAVLPMTTLSNDVSTNLALTMPTSFAGLEGVAVYFQAVFPTLPSTLAPSKSIITDTVPLLIRFD